jgi:hypothetical protein
MGATVPQMGAAAPIVMQMGATDLFEDLLGITYEIDPTQSIPLSAFV